MKNYLTIDLEDWFQVFFAEELITRDSWENQRPLIEPMVDKILAILKQHEVTATFFCVGWLAQTWPEVIKKISDSGHEVASHSYWHKELHKYSSDELVVDLKKSKAALENATGKAVEGFRSPGYSAFPDQALFIEALRLAGFKYDSSDLAFSCKPRLIGAGHILEIAPNGLFIAGRRFPVNGGFVFRCLPYWIYKMYFRLMNLAGQPVNFYIHSWELYTDYPQLPLGGRRSFIQYFNLHRTPKKFVRLLNDFKFTSIQQTLPVKHIEHMDFSG